MNQSRYRICKVVAFFLTMAMILGSGVLIFGTAADPVVWDGTTAASFAGGNGTQANPYQIANGAQLALMSQKITVNKDGNYNRAYYRLTADIVLNTGDATAWGKTAPANKSFTPIGTWSNATSSFGGHFDGQGHTISGLYLKSANDGQGLFGVIQGGAVIENFALVNSYIASTSAGTSGAVIGQTDRANTGNVTIRNIYTDAIISCHGTEVGGIIGNLSDSNANYSAGTVAISDCVFNGTLRNTTGYCGGIVGNARNVTVNLTNCANFGTITAGGQYVAGLLVGQSGCYTISGCVSTGQVTGYDKMLAIACCTSDKADAEGVRTVTNCYYLKGSAEGGATMNADGGATITVLDSAFNLLGTSAAVTISGWTKRAGDLMVPAGVATMMAGKQLVTFELSNGASVRLENPTGLRFQAVISKTWLASLANVTGYGIVIAPTSYVETAGAFTIDALEAINVASGSKYLKIPAVNLMENNSDYAVFSGVLGNIKEENYSADFSAIAYVELTNGDMIYSAYDPSVNSRSVLYVARLAHEDLTETVTGDYTNAVTVPGATAKLYSPYTGSDRATLEGFYRGEKAIRVLQQNLLRDKETEEERSYRFLKEVAKYDPDIILLQEVDKEGAWYNNALKYLSDYTLVGVTSSTFDYKWISISEGYGYPNAPGTYIPAILYRTARFDANGSGIFWLTDTPDTKGSQKFTITVNEETAVYEQNVTRMGCYANLTDRNNNDEAFTCGSLHFSTNNVNYISGTEFSKGDAGAAVREKEAEIYLNYLTEKANGNPILFGGDLNDGNSSKARAYFVNHGYTDSYHDAPENMGGNKYVETLIGHSHIDWCFYGQDDFTALSYHVITDQYLNKSGNEVGRVSDHRGVISDVVMFTAPLNDNLGFDQFIVP